MKRKIFVLTFILAVLSLPPVSASQEIQRHIASIAWNADSSLIGVTYNLIDFDSSTSLEILDTTNLEVWATLPDESGVYQWHPDLPFVLARASSADGFQILDINSQQVLQHGVFEITQAVYTLAWSPDGRMIATGDGYAGIGAVSNGSGKIDIWDSQTGELLIEDLAGAQGFVGDIMWKPDGSQIAYTIINNDPPIVVIIDIDTQEIVSTIIGDSFEDDEGFIFQDVVYPLGWSSNGELFVTYSTLNFDVWDAVIFRSVNHIDAYRGIRKLSSHPSQSLIANSNNDGLQIINFETGQIIHEIVVDAPQEIHATAWSPDGAYFAYVLYNGDDVEDSLQIIDATEIIP